MEIPSFDLMCHDSTQLLKFRDITFFAHSMRTKQHSLLQGRVFIARIRGRGLTIYYFAAWTESDFLLRCDHKHETVTDAIDCGAPSRAASYVVAVENGVPRALNGVEVAEFLRAPRKQPTATMVTYGASGYAVMVPVKFVDGWGWATWMRFETYEEAVAHARGHKVVAFGSSEWNALRQSREPALPTPAIPPVSIQGPWREDETLVDYVSRIIPSPLDHAHLTEKETALPVSSESARPTFIDFVLDWINKWEVKVLDEIYRLKISDWAEALRRRARKGRKEGSHTR